MTDVEFVALRRDRVRNELERVAKEIEAWLARWKEAGAQASQITRCGVALRGMMVRLRADLDKLPADADALAPARRIEWDLSIVERLFRLLEQRFEQRKNPELEETLKAADELIWSCLKLARANLIDSKVKEDLGDKLPLPLAYIDPAFSPTATPRIKPETTQSARDRGLAEMLRVLPVPLIGLPSGTVEEPWWLVLIAHEVGHHVQYDAEANAAAVARTGEVLKTATGDATWEAWRHEVFADLFAAIMLGPVAIEATAELEWDLPEKMADKRLLYPPVIVRLALMAEGARAAKHDKIPFGAESWTDILKQVSAPRREIVEAQLARVPAVVAAVLDMPVGQGSLRGLADSRGAPAAGTSSASDPVVIRDWFDGKNVSVRGGAAVPPNAVREAFQRHRHITARDQNLEKHEKEQRWLRDRAIALIAHFGDPTGMRNPPRGLGSTTKKDVDRMLDELRKVEPE